MTLSKQQEVVQRDLDEAISASETLLGEGRISEAVEAAVELNRAAGRYIQGVPKCDRDVESLQRAYALAAFADLLLQDPQLQVESTADTVSVKVSHPAQHKYCELFCNRDQHPALRKRILQVVVQRGDPLLYLSDVCMESNLLVQPLEAAVRRVDNLLVHLYTGADISNTWYAEHEDGRWKVIPR